MKLLTKLIARGGIAAFFFFSFVLMLLWNALIAGHFGWAPTLSYLQAAGLWLLVGLATAGVGVCARLAFGPHGRRETVDSNGERAFDRHDPDDDLGDRIERRIRRAFARWADEDASADWDRIGERIERKIRDRFREWVD